LLGQPLFELFLLLKFLCLFIDLHFWDGKLSLEADGVENLAVFTWGTVEMHGLVWLFLDVTHPFAVFEGYVLTVSDFAFVFIQVFHLF